MLQLAEELGLDKPTLAEVAQAASSSSRTDASTSRPMPTQLGALLDEAIEQLLQHRHDVDQRKCPLNRCTLIELA